ncbi:carbohydrate ABC transporter permease [Candidatus Aerophobetes bacterium]|nr:carbohydrate ABC transporter permease [Candidatus Aerophobetes bacterium]
MNSFKDRLRKPWIAVIGVMVILSIFPIVWLVLTSFKTLNELFTLPPPIIFKPVLTHWIHVIKYTEFGRYYANSLIIASGSVALSLFLGMMAAYSLARFDIRRKEDFAFWFLSTRMMPPAAVVIPIYLLYFRIGMLDTLKGLIILYAAFNLPFVIWILRGFFEDLPQELEESAMIDGCSIVGAFVRVILPLARPGLLAAGVFSFVLSINEFFFALVLTGSKARPVSVAVTLFLPTGVRGTEYGNATVAATLIMIPGIIIYILFQRFLIRGMTMGAIKT